MIFVVRIDLKFLESHRSELEIVYERLNTTVILLRQRLIKCLVDKYVSKFNSCASRVYYFLLFTEFLFRRYSLSMIVFEGMNLFALFEDFFFVSLTNQIFFIKVFVLADLYRSSNIWRIYILLPVKVLHDLFFLKTFLILKWT